jgi:hypothetical protein
VGYRVAPGPFSNANPITPLLARTPSLPFSANQATALKPRVYPLSTDQPEAALGLSERVDFQVGELEAPLAKGPEGFDRSLEKIRAELLVCQNLADNQLHGSLRHDLHAVGRLPRFRGAFSSSLPSTSEEQCRCRRAIREKPAQGRRQRQSRPPSIRLTTRGVRVNVQRTVCEHRPSGLGNRRSPWHRNCAYLRT